MLAAGAGSTRRPENDAALGAVVMIGLLAGCWHEERSPGAAPPPPPPPAAPACIAEAPGALTLDFHAAGDCTKDPPACTDRCSAGDGTACFQSAVITERNAATAKQAARLYHRACELGLAIGCTNLAAGIWADRAASATQVACARRIFAKACSAGEPFGCGMVGRMTFEAARTPDEYMLGRVQLEAACESIQGFPCRVLAKQLESGKLGSYAPALIQQLLAEACDGGDVDACGQHATAAETFH
jgi:TPR repeat protein